MKIRTTRWAIRMTVMVVAVAAVTSSTAVAESAFTYQGQLKQAGLPVTGSADFEFHLWDAETGGVQFATVNSYGVALTNGLFTVDVDFGAGAFDGSPRYLEVHVAVPSGGALTPLAGRQPITPTPYALALPGLWTQQNDTSPNLIGGYRGNTVTANVAGATIGGGGSYGKTNRVTDEGGTIGGGRNNQAGDNAGTTIDARYATVAGGYSNTASRLRSTIGGGQDNTASGINSTVGGGYNNNASNSNSTVAGGANNVASGNQSTVSGGSANTASGDKSTIGGGENNTANGYLATIPGGSLNEASGTYSLAAGQRAQANHGGSFVWSDSTTTDPDFFYSTGANQFLIKAAGGVGINTNAPGAALHIGGTAGADGLMFPDGTLQTTAATGGGGDSLWSESGSDIFYTAGKVGVGTSSPGSMLHVISLSSNAVTGASNSLSGYGGHFVNTSSDGTALYAESAGAGRDDATLQVHNTQVNAGMAAYLTSVGSWATMHMENDGTGEVLWLARDNSDSEFIVANNEETGGRVFSVNHDGRTKVSMLEITGGEGGIDGLMFSDGTLQTTAAGGGSGDSLWTPSGSNIYYDDGNVGIGTSNPLRRLHVAGESLLGDLVSIGAGTPAKIDLMSDGQMIMREADNTITVNITAEDSGGGGLVLLSNNLGHDTVEIDGDEAGDAALRLSRTGPVNTIVLDADVAGRGAEVLLSDGGGHEVIVLDADTVGNGAMIKLRNETGQTRATLRASQTSDEGARLGLSQASGIETIVLDADHYSVDTDYVHYGARVALNQDNGKTGIVLRAKSTGGGLVQINDSAEQKRVSLGTFDSSGAYFEMRDENNADTVRIYASGAMAGRGYLLNSSSHYGLWMWVSVSRTPLTIRA